MTDQPVNIYRVATSDEYRLVIWVKNKVYEVSEHLRKYLLLYVILVIIIAIPLGYHWATFFKTHKSAIKNAIIALAISTLYPSMVQLRSEKFGAEIKKKPKETVTGLIFIFIVAPFLAMGLANFISNKNTAIGYVAANAVPASSASIAYVLLAEGNIEFATLLAILSVLGALASVPLYVGFYAKTLSVNVPLRLLGESVTLALITPLVLGQLTRYYSIKHRARKILRSPGVSIPCKTLVEKAVWNNSLSIERFLAELEKAIECIEGKLSSKIKPYLSISTMLTMLALIFLLIANKAFILLKKPSIAITIIGLQLVVYGVLIATLIVASRLLSMSYEDHVATVFISMTKNESVAAAVAVMAIGATAAIPAALIPAVQPVVAIAYLHFAPRIRNLFVSKGVLTCKA